MSSSQSDDPINFYFFASWLNSHSKPPLAHEVSRVIVGRAYYAAFLAARDQANQKGTGARIHSEVITHYRTKDSYISNKLADLKRLREQADYNLDNSVSISDINTSLKGSRAILIKLNVLNGIGYPEEYSPLNLA